MMDILGNARRLEHAISKTLDGMSRRLTQSPQREPLAVMLAIVDAVEQETQQGGRGQRVFPFNRIKVSIAVAAREDRARFDAVFEDRPSLEQRIVQRLTAAGCDVTGLGVKVVYVAGPAEQWADPRFQLEFTRAAGPAPAEPETAPPGRIELKVVHGAAAHEKYAFGQGRIDIGRCVEVRDEHNGLLRTNQVAFTDSADPPNASVSRRHAHITCDGRSGVYRILDDRSAHGTVVVREGRNIKVPPGSRGLRLESGDAIVLGAARLAVKITRPGI
jgi:hypothetical protein